MTWLRLYNTGPIFPINDIYSFAGGIHLGTYQGRFLFMRRNFSNAQFKSIPTYTHLSNNQLANFIGVHIKKESLSTQSIIKKRLV